jgi:antitoxin ParD1/3/4
MTLTLDPAIERRIQRQLDHGSFRDPSEVITHALDLMEAEQAGRRSRRAEFIAEIEESLAQADRGEGVRGEELEADFARRKAAYQASQLAPQAAHT